MITIAQFRRIMDIAMTAPLFLEQREWLEAIRESLEAEWIAQEKQQKEGQMRQLADNQEGQENNKK